MSQLTKLAYIEEKANNLIKWLDSLEKSYYGSSVMFTVKSMPLQTMILHFSSAKIEKPREMAEDILKNQLGVDFTDVMLDKLTAYINMFRDLLQDKPE